MDAVEKKREVYESMHQSSVSEEVKEMRMREYRKCKKQVKRIVKES